MKKSLITIIIVLAISLTGLTGVTAFAKAEDVPEDLSITNVALGKEVTFRSLTDMNTQLDAYAYYPDGAGDQFPEVTGSGQCALETWGDMGTLTDGAAVWGTHKSRSTAPNVRGWAFLDLGEEFAILDIKVGYLSDWTFTDVVIQVSNDSTFKTGVTTVFAVCKTLSSGDTVVYNGGQVGCTEATKAATGWDGSSSVKSVYSGLCTYDANGVSARYVRLTCNNPTTNGSTATNETVFNEIQVDAIVNGVVAPTASVASGVHESMTTVTLSSIYENAEIYYTLDGSYPTANSTKYEGAIDLSSATGAFVLRAVAIVDGKSSASADYIYKIATPIENKALGKTVSFRSLTDMNTVLDAYAYYPNGAGDQFPGTGSGQFDLETYGGMKTLTDGDTDWGGRKARSTAPGVRGWAFLDLGEEVIIDTIKVGYLSSWSFTDVVIQVSNDPTFKTGVTTVFAVCETLSSGDTVVYNGGQVGCTEETKAATGWNGGERVISVYDGLCTYDANGVSARYVRLTCNNPTEINGKTATNETVFNEIQVYNKAEVLADPVIKDTAKSTSEIPTEIKVIPGTDKAGVIAKLPETLTVNTMNGATEDISLDWTSEDWEDSTVGTFNFVANVTFTANDVFDVVAERYTVKVTVKKADTSALESLITEVKALDETKYTAKTWSPLATAIEQAETAINDITITETAINGYIETINTAKAGLKELATDKTALQTAIESGNAIVKANYMSSSLEGFDEALATAKTVNEDTDASIEEVENATKTLNDVLSALIEKGDITNLQALVKEIDDANYDEDNYTELSWATLLDALDEAREVLAKAETPKKQVDAVYQALAEAKSGLEAYGDKTELKQLIQEYSALVENDYTKASWGAYATALEDANEILEEKVLQNVVDEAKVNLENAKNALVSLVELKELIEESIDESLYTEISVQVYKDAKEEASLVLSSETATADDVANAVALVKDAKDALALKPTETPDESDGESTGTPTESGATSEENNTSSGCSGSVSGLGALAIATLLGSVVVLKKKEN